MNETSLVIAVVDDEPQMRKALRRLLSSHGFRVDDYQRGSDFLAAQPSYPVACLILDLHMPDVSGFDALTAMQSINTPIVVLTGHDEPGTAERTRRLGASAYLKKPVDELALISAIRSAIAEG